MPEKCQRRGMIAAPATETVEASKNFRRVMVCGGMSASWPDIQIRKPYSKGTPIPLLRGFLIALNQLDMAAALCGEVFAVLGIMDDRPQQKIAGSIRKFEFVIKRLLTEWRNTKLCRLSSCRLALRIFERQRERALDLAILVVYQHDWKGSSGAGFYRGLPKTQVNPYWSKCVAHVIAKVRVEFQLLHVAKMIRSITCRITAGEINKVQHARVVSIGAPIFRDACEQVSVKGQPLLRSRILTEKGWVKVLGQLRRRAIPVEPKPSVLIKNQRVSGRSARRHSSGIFQSGHAEARSAVGHGLKLVGM